MYSTVYLYRLFAYIVSDATDFPSDNTPKVKLPEAGEVGNVDDDPNGKNAFFFEWAHQKTPTAQGLEERGVSNN